MANLITEGFDWFPAGQSLAIRQAIWSANSFYKFGSFDCDVTAGRFGYGQAMLFNATSNNGVSSGYVAPINSVIATGFIGFAMHIYSGVNALPLIGYFDAVNNLIQVSITFEANGVIRVWRGDRAAGNQLVASAAGVYQLDKDFHVEMLALIGPAAGTVEVRINTVPVIQLTGANTRAGTLSSFDAVILGSFTNSGQPPNHYVDDLFVNDMTTAQNNTWSGNLRVKTQFMIANGNTDNFTIGGTAPAATNWQSVNNQLIDDTKYVYSSTVNQIDQYTPNPNINAAQVRVVQVRAALRQDDATQRSAKMELRIGTTVYENTATHFTNQQFTFYKARWESSPATAVTFTGAEVNGLQVGVKVQS